MTAFAAEPTARGKIAVTMPGGGVQYAPWPEDVSARLAVMCIMSTTPESFGGSL